MSGVWEAEGEMHKARAGAREGTHPVPLGDPEGAPGATSAATPEATPDATEERTRGDGSGADPMEPVTQPQEAERDAQGRRMCGARTRDGGSCRAPAMDGQRRCRGHGGASPQARKAARLRLADLQDPAIATLARLMATGSTEMIRFRAAEAILDRGGNPRSSRVEATIQQQAEQSREMLVERLRQLRDEKAAERGEIEAAPARPVEDVVDAEVVSEPDADAAAALVDRLRAMRAEQEERAAARAEAAAQVAADLAADDEPDATGGDEEEAVLEATVEPDPDATFPRAPRRYGQGTPSGRVSTAALAEVLAAARMR